MMSQDDDDMQNSYGWLEHDVNDEKKQLGSPKDGVDNPLQ